MQPIPLIPERRTPVGALVLRVFAVFCCLVVVPVLGLALFRVGEVPHLVISPALPGIGQATKVEISAQTGARGLSTLKAELVQGDLVVTLADKQYQPRPFWAFWGQAQSRDQFTVEVGRKIQSDLRPGEATIRVTAGRVGTWLRRLDPAVEELTLPVRFNPPTLAARSPEPDVAYQGGSGVVLYQVDAHATRHGVKVGNYEFPGSPLPGGEAGLHFAFFGVPFGEKEGLREVKLFARDDLGNETQRAFLQRFDPRKIPADDIQLNDAFLGRAVPEIMAATPSLKDSGDPVENYVAINRDLRQVNEARLVELAKSSKAAMLWHGPFAQLPNGKVMAGFAEERTYFYAGKQVDLQYHLGYDLASTQRAPVPAANSGVVVLSEYFGIYGNTVIVDHGYGVMSLYSHLSSLGVKVGDQVSRGQSLGQTGITGLAGGDHLHFGILIHGLQVDPLEWLDGHWIKTRIANKLAPAFQVLD